MATIQEAESLSYSRQGRRRRRHNTRINMITTPLEQFEILPLFTLILGEKFAITNATFFLFVVARVILSILYLGRAYRATLLPNRWQALVEFLYEFVLDRVQDTIGAKGYKYFPWIFVTFIFILTCNRRGRIPYTFTVTSHIIITFGFGRATFIGVNIVAFREHGLHFFSFFVPKEAPAALRPFLILIEFISYVFRVVSLSVRLFANRRSGHTLLKILAGFSWTRISLGGIFYVLQLFPLAVVFALTGLELGIAFLQAYVWTILVCIYLNDAINLH